ncbi:type 4a pilus biogenesis protein PilO, partial [Candidatus Babeliales bacterium]|nr:type 4a pilus biogenesis protein PilO [Candidatus Babeliales bacterium]
NEIASNNGLLVKELVLVKAGDTKLSPGVLKEQKAFERSCYHMKISGDFTDFYTFVRELNTIEYLVNITNFSVEGAAEAGRVNVDMLVII